MKQRLTKLFLLFFKLLIAFYWLGFNLFCRRIRTLQGFSISLYIWRGCFTRSIAHFRAICGVHMRFAILEKYGPKSDIPISVIQNFLQKERRTKIEAFYRLRLWGHNSIFFSRTHIKKVDETQLLRTQTTVDNCFVLTLVIWARDTFPFHAAATITTNSQAPPISYPE